VERTDHDVVALTRTISPARQPADPRVWWRQGDLASPHDAVDFVDGLDCVVHLAHTNTPLTSNRDLPSDAAMNLVPTLNLIQALRQVTRDCHVVFASSGGAIYRGSVDGVPVTENSPVEPTTSYGIQKLAAEHYLRLAAGEGWLSTSVLRIGNAYGALLPPERLQGFLGVAVAQLAAGNPIRVFGSTANVRDYVHLDDICRVIELAVDQRPDFGLFNVGSGQGVSVADLIELLGSIVGAPAAVEHDMPTRDAERLPAWIVLDSSKAARELGWSASVLLEDGLRALWEEARER
jgi:UDP-glucose 4-epimerase